MNIADELVELDDINHCGFALLQYAVSLPGDEYNQFEKKSERWVCDPNFVTFEIHHKRANNISLSLRGNPEEFQQSDELPLKKGMDGYSACSFESPHQLFAATSYIRRAWELYQRGRTRSKTQPRTIEEQLP